MKATVGLELTGCDIELEIVKETEKAYLCKNWMGVERWLPRIAFDETGELKRNFYKMYDDKFNEPIGGYDGQNR